MCSALFPCDVGQGVLKGFMRGIAIWGGLGQAVLIIPYRMTISCYGVDGQLSLRTVKLNATIGIRRMVCPSNVIWEDALNYRHYDHYQQIADQGCRCGSRQ